MRASRIKGNNSRDGKGGRAFEKGHVITAAEAPLPTSLLKYISYRREPPPGAPLSFLWGRPPAQLFQCRLLFRRRTLLYRKGGRDPRPAWTGWVRGCMRRRLLRPFICDKDLLSLFGRREGGRDLGSDAHIAEAKRIESRVRRTQYARYYCTVRAKRLSFCLPFFPFGKGLNGPHDLPLPFFRAIERGRGKKL